MLSNSRLVTHHLFLQEIGNYLDYGPEVKVLRMDDPDRNQGTLPFGAA